MLPATIAAPSRWVLRALWLIALILVVFVLSVRTNNILGQSQQILDRLRTSAATAFSLPPESRDVPHSLDSLTWPGHAAVILHPNLIAAVPPNAPLTVSGWAFDSQAKAPFAGIGAKIDRRPDVYYSFMNLARADVAAALRDSRARQSGFVTSLDVGVLPPGLHSIEFRALSRDEKTAVSLGTVQFTIASGTFDEQKTDSIDAINGILINARASEAAPIPVTRSARRISLTGWGFITNGRRLASSAVLLVDGNPALPVRYGLQRPDVASAYHDVRVSRSGFEVTLPLDSVPNGVHELRLRMNSSDGQAVEATSALKIDLRGYL